MNKILSYKEPKSVIAEQYRSIRTSIQYSNLDKKLKTILVTSSTKNEGKTTTTTNLAVNFAAIDKKKVLIIDCDLRNPSVHKAFGITNAGGLTDLLIEQKNIVNYIKTTEIDNLQVLTSGLIPPNPSEILASKVMEDLLSSLKEMYDYIFIDTPPIGMVTDAGILANKVDGSILVVKSNGVEVKQLEETKRKLDAVNANVIGVVLNAYKVEKDDYYYYSYYGSK